MCKSGGFRKIRSKEIKQVRAILRKGSPTPERAPEQ
jgi:hypothetical protein